MTERQSFSTTVLIDLAEVTEYHFSVNPYTATGRHGVSKLKTMD